MDFKKKIEKAQVALVLIMIKTDEKGHVLFYGADCMASILGLMSMLVCCNACK